jgi:serine/threonine protein kinase
MFSENYSICLNDDGSPREIGRNGPVVTYKAIGYDSGRTVAMQLIPLASLSEGERVRLEESAQAARKLDHDNITKIFDVGDEDNHLVIVSEYVEGESAEEWIDEHGPMPADAVLRIGFQVANALAAAEGRGVPPGTIQPANLVIVPGVAADGGWPGLKVRNFGLPVVKLNSEEGETRELVPSMPPQFACPEQRENTALDIRADIFSLGATMWYLLSGSAPPLAGPNESGPRLSAPDVPRFVRNLVSHTLRTDPERRPQDLAAFAERIRACLQKAERRTAFTRSFAPAAIPGTQKVEKKRIAPALALAAAIIILVALGAFFLPQRFANRERKPLGVMIGVPETTSLSAAVSESPAAPTNVNQEAGQSAVVAQQSPAQIVSPAAAAETAEKLAPPPQLAGKKATNAVSPASTTATDQSGSVAQQSVSPPSPPANSPGGASSASPDVDKLSSSPQLVDNNRLAEQPAPAEGPAQTNQPLVAAEPLPSAEKGEPPPSDVPDNAAGAATDSSSASNEKAKATTPQSSSENVRKRDESRSSKRKSRQHVARSSVPRRVAPLHVGSESARVVGTTAHGNWVLRLPSGETVIAPPIPNLEDAPIVTPRHIRRVERPIPVEDEPPIVVLPPGY